MSHDLFGQVDITTPDGHDVAHVSESGGHYAIGSPEGLDLAHSEHFAGVEMVLSPTGHELLTIDHEGNVWEHDHVVATISHGHQAGHDTTSLSDLNGVPILTMHDGSGGIDVSSPAGQALFHLQQRFGA